MAVLIQDTVDHSVSAEPVVVHVDRHTLYKRRWRATAEDGTELAVDLKSPVSDAALLSSKEGAVFQVKQIKEDVIVIPLPNKSEMAAQLGWYLGNQHLPVEVRSDAIIVEQVNTLAASLDRIGIPYTSSHDVFRCRMHSHQH